MVWHSTCTESPAPANWPRGAYDINNNAQAKRLGVFRSSLLLRVDRGLVWRVLPDSRVEIQIGEVLRVEYRRFYARLDLAVVVAHQTQADLEQQYQGDQVADGQQAHGHVGEGEHRAQILHRAPEYQSHYQHTVDHHRAALLAEEAQGVLTQVVV